MAELSVTIDSRGARTGGADVERVLHSVGRTAGTTVNKFQKMSRSIGNSFDRVKSRIFNLQNAIMGLSGVYGLGKIAQSALDTASSFEMMEVKLDTLTKGKGVETLERINKWALDMPVNTKKAVDAFTMMMAMGLDPTLEKEMRILVDVASILGEDTLPRVARQLGQMQSLGKISAEELNTLADAGINARKYLEEFGMTLEDLQKAVAEGKIPITAVIDAIWEGLDKDFGGGAKKAMKAWDGLVASFKSYITEIERTVMGAGVFEALKGHLKTVNDWLKKWLETNKELIKQKVPIYIEKIETKIRSLWDYLSGISKGSYAAMSGGLIGRFLFGGTGALVLAALAAINVKTDNFLSKKWNTEMTLGLVGGLLFGGKYGLIAGGLIAIDGFLGGPILTKAKEFLGTIIEWGKELIKVFGPSLKELFDQTLSDFDTFVQGFHDSHIELADGTKLRCDNVNENSLALIETLKTFALDTYGVLREATETTLSLVDPPIQAIADLIMELGKLGIDLIAADVNRLGKAFKDLWGHLKNLLPSWESFKTAAAWLGSNLAGIIDKITIATNKLRDFLKKSREDVEDVSTDIGKLREELEKLPDLTKEFPAEGKLDIEITGAEEATKIINETSDSLNNLPTQPEVDIKITGSGSTTLPIMDKITQISKGLNTLSGQSDYHVRIKHPSISEVPQMTQPSLSTGSASYEDIKKGVDIVGKSLMKGWKEDRGLILDYISRNAKRSAGESFDYSALIKAINTPSKKRAEYKKGADEMYYAQAMASEGSGDFLSKLLAQYEAVKKGIAIKADFKLKEYREDRKHILDYQSRTLGFDVGETTRALVSPGKRHKEYLKTAEMEFLEPLRKQIEEYNDNLKKEFKSSSLDLSRYSTAALAELQKLGEFYSDYKFPAGATATLTHSPKGSWGLSFKGDKPSIFSKAFLGQGDGDGRAEKALGDYQSVEPSDTTENINKRFLGVADIAEKALGDYQSVEPSDTTKEIKEGINEGITEGITEGMAATTGFLRMSKMIPRTAGELQDTTGRGIPMLVPGVRERPPAGMPSIIINTGDLHVRAAADDPDAVKAIDERLAELIRSGRSRIPRIVNLY